MSGAKSGRPGLPNEETASLTAAAANSSPFIDRFIRIALTSAKRGKGRHLDQDDTAQPSQHHSPGTKDGSDAKETRGPRPALDNHRKVAAIVAKVRESWTTDEGLRKVCDELDRQRVPAVTTWLMRKEGKAQSWRRARELYPHLVIKTIKYRCKATSPT